MTTETLRAAIAEIIEPEAMKSYNRDSFRVTCRVNIALKKADLILEKIRETEPGFPW